jgi:hypothetical protein
MAFLSVSTFLTGCHCKLRPNTKGAVSEELLVGDAIYTDCVATDEDATNLGKIIYTVVSSTDDAFTVNASTGVISIAKLLNREAFATYVVVIRATDQGGTALGGALVRCAFDVGEMYTRGCHWIPRMFALKRTRV